MYSYFLVLLVIIEYSVTFESSKSIEGYPVGYLSDCPGLTEAVVTIKKDTLKHLSFAIQREGFFLTANRTRYNYYQMKDLVKDPHINFTRKTVIYVGGWHESPDYWISGSIAYEYKRLNYNVLSLDTKKFTSFPYPLAALYVRAASKHAAEMLANLTELGMNPETAELIGISLGGQTVSFIAKNYRQITGRNISRITALDPSGPCFRHLGPKDRLDESDADFVDVISTNIDGYGMAAPVGHVNFYANGGEYQANEFILLPCTDSCSHIRSLGLWISALQNPNSFIGLKCDSVQDARLKNCYKDPKVTNVMGLEVDRSKHGIFFLPTTNKYPYFMGKKGLKKENDFFSSMLKKFIANSRKII